MQVVTLLNDLYLAFDSVMDNLKVYKNADHRRRVHGHVWTARVHHGPSPLTNCAGTELEQFLNHRKEHGQLLQQRLVTIIKRVAVDNLNSASVGNSGTKMDKMSKALGGRTVDKALL
uniref:Uncharacterized protein n=1 Tax=Globodera pallida TaxID=36090 RepID=A0A183BP90_GLOPA